LDSDAASGVGIARPRVPIRAYGPVPWGSHWAPRGHARLRPLGEGYSGHGGRGSKPPKEGHMPLRFGFLFRPKCICTPHALPCIIFPLLLSPSPLLSLLYLEGAGNEKRIHHGHAHEHSTYGGSNYVDVTLLIPLIIHPFPSLPALRRDGDGSPPPRLHPPVAAPRAHWQRRARTHRHGHPRLPRPRPPALPAIYPLRLARAVAVLRRVA